MNLSSLLLHHCVIKLIHCELLVLHNCSCNAGEHSILDAINLKLYDSIEHDLTQSMNLLLLFIIYIFL
jgi:hypothetical protein